MEFIVFYTYIMQMSRAWMYADRCSDEFIKGVREFLMWLRQTSEIILCVVHVVNVGTRRITLTKKPFTATCFGTVSCPAIMVGPSTEKEGL